MSAAVCGEDGGAARTDRSAHSQLGAARAARHPHSPQRAGGAGSLRHPRGAGEGLLWGGLRLRFMVRFHSRELPAAVLVAREFGARSGGPSPVCLLAEESAGG